MEGVFKDRVEMIWGCEEPTLDMRHDETKEHIFGPDSGIPYLFLIKLLSDLDSKMERLARIYNERTPPGLPVNQVASRPSTPNAEHLALCYSCWKRYLHWIDICKWFQDLRRNT